jgi:hypothetical protein
VYCPAKARAAHCTKHPRTAWCKLSATSIA